MADRDDEIPPPNVTLVVVGALGMAYFLTLTSRRQARFIASLRRVVDAHAVNPRPWTTPDMDLLGERRSVLGLSVRLGMAWITRFADHLERISAEDLKNQSLL
jgi:hypothetical protein